MDYSFGFFAVLFLMTVSYEIGLYIGYGKSRRGDSNPEIVKIDIELDSNILYAYVHGTKKFLAQGKTYQELQNSLKVQNPNITYIANSEQVKSFENTNA